LRELDEVSERKIDAIQALRGFAALLVVARHAWPSFRVGGSGVDLFFIISGFTMLYSSQHAFGSASSIVPFIKRRLIRIYPTYWAATALFIVLMGMPSIPALIGSLLLIPIQFPPFLSPGWTLIFELMFYGIFAAFLFLPMKTASAAVLGALLALVSVGPLVPFLEVYSHPIILEFGIGILIGLAYCQGARVSGNAATIILGLGVCCLCLSVLLGELGDREWARQVFWGLPFAAILVALVFGPEVSLLRRNVFQRLGEASYSIYVTHWIVVVGFHPHNHKGIVFLASIFLGVGFYHIVERPTLLFLRAKLLGQPKHPKARQGSATAIVDNSENVLQT